MPDDGKWVLRVVVLTAAALIGLYAWSFDNPIMASDSRNVLNEYYLGSPGLAVQLFVNAPERSEGVHERYSPLASLSLALNRALWGHDPRGYRATATLLHGLCAVLIFLLMVRFGVGKTWALFASLVFAVHPIHTQTINILASRGHILSGVLTLAAVLLFTGSLLRGAGGLGLRRPAGSWGAVALFFFALLCGWEALAFVFACALLPIVLGVSYPNWRFYAGVGIALGLYAVMALVAGGPGSLFLSQGHWGAASLFKALGLILRIPAKQMIFHPMDFVFSWADGRALAGPGVAVALAIASVVLRNRRRGIALALGLTACVLPAYFFAVESEGALWEPGLYLLAAAVCVVVGAVADLLARMRGARPVVVLIMILMLGAGFVSAVARNSLWSDPERVWKEVLEAYPTSGFAIEELAEYYRRSGRAAEAAELATPKGENEFALAMKLNNEGVALMDVGRLGPAVEKFREAVELWPDLRDSHFNLGVAYHNMRMDDSAMVSLGRAAAIDPMHADTRYNLGIVCDALGDAERAEIAYREAVSLDEGHARAWANLGALLGRGGNLGGAIESLERALRIDPGLLPARYNLALAYERVDVEKAKEEWRAYLNLARQRGVDPARLSQIERRLQGL